MKFELTFNWLPILAILLSLAGWYLPVFKEWFAALTEVKKQLFMAGVLLLIVLGGVGLSIGGFVSIYHGPTWKEWVWYPAVDYIFGLITNAGFYKATDRIFTKRE